MAFNAEQLNIVVAARTQDLQKELTNAERRIKRFERQSKENLSQTARHFDTLGMAAKRLVPLITAAFGARAIMNMTQSAAEIGKLAALAGTGVVEFQRFAVAAQTVGIEMGKSADILKDVQDRIGDFLATGGGPMADFFENIAPQVGVTAEQFAKLSGPQALQLYVTSLQRANVTQAEMTFYLEALASDASALVPLLGNSGEAMKRLGDEAERTGRILDKDAVDGARELEKEASALAETIRLSLTSAILDNKDELLALVGFITNTAIPAFASLIGTITRGLELYNAARGIDTSGLGAETDPAIRQQEVEETGALGRGDPSRSGLFVVDPNTGAIIPAGLPPSPFMGEGDTGPAQGGVQMDLGTINVPIDTGEGGTSGGAGTDPLQQLRERLQEAREMLDFFRLSETEAQLAEYENRQALLDEALNNELLTQEEYNRLKEENQRQHSQKIAEIVAAERAVRLGEMSSMFSALADIAEHGGKKAVKAQAVLSAAATMIAAYENAVTAAAKAQTIPGKIAAYAGFLAQGLAAVKKIQSVGNSARATSGGGGGGGGAGAAAAPQVSRNVAIQLTGGDMYSRDQVIQLINGINEAVEDGAVVRLV